MKFWMPSKLQSRGFCRKNGRTIRRRSTGTRTASGAAKWRVRLVNIDPAELAGFARFDALIRAMEIILITGADLLHQRSQHEQDGQGAKGGHDAIGAEGRIKGLDRTPHQRRAVGAV